MAQQPFLARSYYSSGCFNSLALGCCPREIKVEAFRIYEVEFTVTKSMGPTDLRTSAFKNRSRISLHLILHLYANMLASLQKFLGCLILTSVVFCHTVSYVPVPISVQQCLMKTSQLSAIHVLVGCPRSLSQFLNPITLFIP